MKIAQKSASIATIAKRAGLTTLVAASLVLSGCDVHSSYDYDGKIGQDWVKSTCNFGSTHNKLYVTEANQKITYDWAMEEDMPMVMKITIMTGDGKSTVYKNDAIGEELMRKEQIQLTNYLATILKIQRNKAISAIKR